MTFSRTTFDDNDTTTLSTQREHQNPKAVQKDRTPKTKDTQFLFRLIHFDRYAGGMAVELGSVHALNFRDARFVNPGVLDTH